MEEAKLQIPYDTVIEEYKKELFDKTEALLLEKAKAKYLYGELLKAQNEAADFKGEIEAIRNAQSISEG